MALAAGPGSLTLPGTFEKEDAVSQAPPRESPPSLGSVSKTLHLCKVTACCVVKCFRMLEVFDHIKGGKRVATGPSIVLFGEI